MTLGRTFLDLDQEIERREGRSIGQIFGEKGEAYFRKKEREITEELTLVGNMIVSPGGGWAADPDTVGIVCPPSKSGLPAGDAKDRVEAIGPYAADASALSRPDPLAELNRSTLEARKQAYEAADHVINTELLDLQRVIDRVTELATVGLHP